MVVIVMKMFEKKYGCELRYVRRRSLNGAVARVKQHLSGAWYLILAI